jgi:hypothetical protein
MNVQSGIMAGFNRQPDLPDARKGAATQFVAGFESSKQGEPRRWQTGLLHFCFGSLWLTAIVPPVTRVFTAMEACLFIVVFSFRFERVLGPSARC